VSAYSVVLAVHIMGVVLAYGLTLTYPVLIPYVRRHHPEALPGLHDVQHLLNQRLTGPGTAVVLAAGIYLATDSHQWDEPFVGVGLASILIIGAVGGAIIVPASKKMAELAGAPEYERVYRRYMRAEVFLGVVVLVAIFFMAAKPGS
jgi:hypothetical protein